MLENVEISVIGNGSACIGISRSLAPSAEEHGQLSHLGRVLGPACCRQGLKVVVCLRSNDWLRDDFGRVRKTGVADRSRWRLES
jgi:hypothetical protein